MITVREHQLDDVVSKLLEFSRCQNSEDGTARRYLLCGKRLVPWCRALADPSAFGKFLKGRRWKDCCVKLPFRADAIQIKNNLRVFGYGPKKDLTAKIALAGLLRDGTLSREVRARQFLAETIKPSFGVAPVVSHDRHGARWFVEKQISLNGKKDSLAEEFIADHALGFYRATHRTRGMGQRLVGGLSVEKLVAFLPEASRLYICEQLNSLHWPIALGHGDLSKRNMIRDARGRLYLIDWERADVGPVAFDLRGLYASHPKLRNAILALIGSLGHQTTNTASPELQMALAFAAEAGRLERDRKYVTRYFMHRDQVGVEQADLYVHGLIARSQQLAGTLVPL